MFHLDPDHTGLPAKGKRQRSPDEASTNDDASATQQPPEATAKHPRLSADERVAQQITIHCVTCSRTRRHHESHPSRSYYLEPPAMIASDHQARALHGRTRIRDVENYLGERLGFTCTIAISIDYDCEAYHDNIKDAFIRIPMPPMPEDIGIDMKPYFRILQHDGPTANATSERLQLSENLEEALHTLQDQNADMMEEWDFEEDLDHPYPKFDQFKHVFIGPRAQALEPQQQKDLKVLSDYITERLALDYEELKQLSTAGLVSRKYWLMLFRPDDTVVTMLDGQYRALSVKSRFQLEPNTLELECWSWEYDGNFYRKHTKMHIEWPSSSNQVEITDLSAYPILYAEDGVESRLRTRGNTFWSCRRKRYMNYHTPLQGLGSQNVRFQSEWEKALLTQPGQFTVHGRRGSLQADAWPR